MRNSAVRDMTEGSPAKHIIGFFFPLLFGILFQQIYNMVDTIIVGRFLGVEALAGVGSSGSLNFLVLGFCIGICTGFSIPVAQKFGEHDYRGLKCFVTNAFMLSAILAAVITTVVCMLTEPMLRLMNTPEDILSYAVSYLFVIFLGIPVTIACNILFGVIRSLGDSRSPLVYLLISSVLNIVLDLLFILVFRTGVAGAAWATVISQLVSALLGVRYVMKSDVLIFEKTDWKLDPACVKQLFSMGVPTGLQYSVTAIGSIVMQTAINTLGSMYVASAAASSKVCQLFNCPFDAMGSTMATYGGQNAGAGRLDRIRKGLNSCTLLGIAYSVIGFVILYFFGENVILMFVDASETEVIANGCKMILFNSSFYILLAFVNILRFLIQGMGFTKQAVLAGACEMVARVFVGWVLVPAYGYTAACMGHPAAWILADLFLFPAYFWAMKKTKQRIEAQNAVPV